MSAGVRRSTYLTPLEADLATQIAAENATSVNFVLRVGLRALAGLPVPVLRIPAEESGGEKVSAGVSAG